MRLERGLSPSARFGSALTFAGRALFLFGGLDYRYHRKYDYHDVFCLHHQNVPKHRFGTFFFAMTKAGI